MKTSVNDYYYIQDEDEERFSNTCLKTEKSEDLLYRYTPTFSKGYWSPKFNPKIHRWCEASEEIVKKEKVF